MQEHDEDLTGTPTRQRVLHTASGPPLGTNGVLLFALACLWGIVGLVALFWPLALHSAFVDLNLRLGSFRYYFPEDQSSVFRAIAVAGSFSTAALLVACGLERRGVRAVRVLALVTRLAAFFAWFVIWSERPGLIACAIPLLVEGATALVLTLGLRGLRVPESQR